MQDCCYGGGGSGGGGGEREGKGAGGQGLNLGRNPCTHGGGTACRHLAVQTLIQSAYWPSPGYGAVYAMVRPLRCFQTG